MAPAKIKKISLLGAAPSSSCNISSTFPSVTSDGEFVYNSVYDYTRLVGIKPTNWTAQGVTVE